MSKYISRPLLLVFYPGLFSISIISSRTKSKPPPKQLPLSHPRFLPNLNSYRSFDSPTAYQITSLTTITMMFAKTLNLLTALLAASPSLVAAMPTAVKTTDVNATSTTDVETSPNLYPGGHLGAEISKRNGQSYCCMEGLDDSVTTMHIFTEGWGHDDETSRSGCGGGLFDNIVGQCGSAVNWRCRPGEFRGAQGTKYRAQVWTWLIPKCVQDGIWLASPPSRREEGVNCNRICSNEMLVPL